MVSHRLPKIRVPTHIVLLLSLLVVAGLYLRLTYLQTISLHVDEFISLLAIRGILQHGYPLLPSGTLYEQGLLFSYLNALALRVLGFSATVGRALSFIISVTTIPLLYYVGKRLFSAPAGLVAATLGALSPESIAWGGRVRMYALLQLLVLLSVWFLWQGAIRKDDRRYRWISILCYLGALFTHPVSVLLFPPFLLSLLLLRGPRGLLKPGLILEAVVPLCGILATFLLKMVGQPGQLGALAQARPYLAPSLDIAAGFRPLLSFFGRREQVPLTIFALAGLLVLLIAITRKVRRRTAAEALEPDLRSLLFLYIIFGATVFEMVFLVGPTWRDVRYIFMVAPLWLLVASWMTVFAATWLPRVVERTRLAWLWDRSKAEPISWPLTCLLVAGAFLLFVPAAHAAVTKQEWGYDLAFEYLQEHWREGDTVLTTVPFACELYLPQCDYYASGRAYEEYVFETEGILLDRWVGAELLDSATRLDKVLRNSSRTWFVVDGWRLAARFDLDFIRTVAEQMEVVHEVQGVRVLLAERYRTPTEPEIAGSVEVNFADQIKLVGYELSTDSLDPESELTLTLYWEALRPIDEQYTVFVHLRGPDGSGVAQSDSPPLENLYPTTYWSEGVTVPDPRVLSTAADVDPGRYRLEVGLYNARDQQRLPILDERGSASGDGVILDYVRIGEGTDDLEPGYTLGANLADHVLFMGHEGVPASVEPGQDIHLTVYWQALSRMEEDYTVFIHMVGAEGRPVAQHDGQPLVGFYPTSFWKPGEVVRDEYEIHVDSSTPSGEYELEAGMYLLSTGDRLPIRDEGGQIVGDLIPLGEIVVVER